MENLCKAVLCAMAGRTLVTAESLTGGGIGSALTAVPGSSDVYKGGVISYTDCVKADLLGVAPQVLETYGAVSAPVAEAMARGARSRLQADVAVSVTGLAGPGGDAFGNPVGTVFVGYCDEKETVSRHFRFTGTRQEIREKTIRAALMLVLEKNQK